LDQLVPEVYRGAVDGYAAVFVGDSEGHVAHISHGIDEATEVAKGRHGAHEAG
jgi:hypothetical protein